MRRALLALALLSCLLPAGCSRGERSLRLLHTSDLHARLTPDDRGLGGFAYMATAIAENKADAPDRTLVLHAGDFVQGTPVSTLFRGMPAYEVANLLGFDVNTLGNHEFDYGWERTREFIRAGRFKTISANVVDESGATLAEPTATFTVNGVRVGVIGLVTEQLDNLTMARVRGPWSAAPVVETARRYSEQLESDTDLIIVLAHCFDDEDEAILQGAPLVDLVVSGHNHGGQEEVKDFDGRLIVKVRSYGRELGRLDLTYNLDEERVVAFDWRRIQVSTDAFEPEPETARLVDEWETKVSDLVDQPIGRATSRLGKAELQPWLERVMRETVGADFAFQNEGGIRDSLSEGQVTRRNIWNMLPFGNDILYGTVRGDRIPGEIRDSGARIDPARDYVIATNTFIADKWAERGLRLDHTGPVLREAAIEWIEAHGTIP